MWKGFPVTPRGKHIFGVVRVGERGQVVIPKGAREVPSAFENAGSAPGFAKVATLKAGGRVSAPACICRACGTVTVKIEESLR